MPDLSTLFYPRSIAFVGASEQLRKWGSFLFTNILDGGYRGRVYPVSRGKETVFGLPAYDSVRRRLIALRWCAPWWALANWVNATARSRRSTSTRLSSTGLSLWQSTR